MIHVIVNTCDQYAPVIPKWLTFWYRYWTLPHRIVIVGVSHYSLKAPIDLRDAPVSAFYVEKDNGWAYNLLVYLEKRKLMYGESPFLMLMDDHIIFEVDNDLIRTAQDIIERPDVGCVRLVPWPGPTLPYNAPGFGEIDKRQEYAISLQASFWKPQTLIDLLDPGWSPWQIELLGSKRAAGYDKRFIGCQSCAINYKDYFCRGKPREGHAAWVDEHL